MAMPKSRRRAVHSPHRTSPVADAVAADAVSVRSPRAIQLLIVALLAAVALMSTAERARTNDGVDSFNLWGVPEVLTDHGLGTPYHEGQEYLVELKAHAAAAGDAKLVSAGEYWHTPDFTASPLLYTVFAVFSVDYGTSLEVSL